MPSFLVLVNPGAGSVDDAVTCDDPSSWQHDEDLSRIDRELATQGPVRTVLVADDDDVRAAIEDAEPDTVLVVVGGDGTLHRFVNLMGRRDNPVLLVPGGTGNDVAGGLGLPEDPVEAASLARTGRLCTMDVMTVGDTRAVNAAHIGVGVDAAQAAQGLKAAMGKAAYPAGAVRAAAGFEPLTATVVVDDETVLDATRVAMLGVFNGPRIGGGTWICPPADPSDGQLDVVVLTADTRTELAATTAAVLRGTHLEREDVIHRSGRSVEVTVHDAGTEVAWNVDGELLDLPARTSITVDPGVWRLHVPSSDG